MSKITDRIVDMVAKLYTVADGKSPHVGRIELVEILNAARNEIIRLADHEERILAAGDKAMESFKDSLEYFRG